MTRLHWVRAGDWLLAGLNSHQNEHSIIDRTIDGITVMFDGYLNDYTGHRIDGFDLDRPAASLAVLYDSVCTDFIPDLRGSFIALVIDTVRKVAWLLTQSKPLEPQQI